jgi:hypothetical protein
MLDESKALLERSARAFANGEDVDNEAEDCVRNLWRVGKKHFLFDGLDLGL